MSQLSKGASLASVAALMAFSMAASAASSPAGSSDCKTAENSCKGQNACGGHGFKGMAASACLEKGGVIADLKAK